MSDAFSSPSSLSTACAGVYTGGLLYYSSPPVAQPGYFVSYSDALISPNSTGGGVVYTVFGTQFVPDAFAACAAAWPQNAVDGVCVAPCFPAAVCLGGDAQNTLDNVCAPYAAGDRCMECVPGSARLGGVCQPCPAEAGAYLLFIVYSLVLIGSVAVIYVMVEAKLTVGYASIAIDCFQASHLGWYCASFSSIDTASC